MKTDNTINFFIIITFLSPAALHISMLSYFENTASQVVDIT